MNFQNRAARVAEDVLSNQGAVLSTVGSIWIVTCIFAVLAGWSLASTLAIPLVYELALRTLLILAYGRHFRYAVFPFVLVNDKDYGYTLRRSVDISKVDFLLFDKFVFPPPARRLIDHTENRVRRIRFKVNSLGFRGEEFDPWVKSRRVRIFCSGDSITIGQGVSDENTWPSALQRHLEKCGIDAEVINAGVFGWTAHQEAARLKNEIIHYRPDVILLHQGWNDEFHFSSLAHGKYWRPKLVRSRIETNELFLSKGGFLSNEIIYSQYLALRYLRRKWVYRKYLDFANDSRWQVLQARDYIHAWGQSILEIAQIAKSTNSLLYSIDYPVLVSDSDTAENRELYLRRSRLTARYADYQAISKARISQTLSEFSDTVPCLNISPDFEHVVGEERLRFFIDSIHYSDWGGSEIGRVVAAHLMAQPDFLSRAAGGNFLSNVALDDPLQLRSLLEGLGRNSPYIENLINQYRPRKVHPLISGR